MVSFLMVFMLLSESRIYLASRKGTCLYSFPFISYSCAHHLDSPHRYPFFEDSLLGKVCFKSGSFDKKTASAFLDFTRQMLGVNPARLEVIDHCGLLKAIAFYN